MTEEQKTSATYRVEPAGRPKRPMPGQRTKGPLAVLVAHGMGQQVPFQTLDDVAEGLLAQDRVRRGGREPPVPGARTVLVGKEKERLQRLELKMVDRENQERDVHVYEAYWAPYTEGRVTLRDVTLFLIRTALFGIHSARRPFQRWLFGADRRFPPPVRTVMYLIVALAVVVSLVVINAIMLAIAAARAPMQLPPAWLSPALFGDITTILNVLVVVFLLFALTIGTTMWARARGRRLPGWLSIVTFAVAVWTTVAAAIAAASVLAYHARSAAQTSIFDAPPLAAARSRFDAAFDQIAVVVVLLAVAWLVYRGVRTLIQATDKFTIRVGAGFVVFVLSLAGVAMLFVSRLGGPSAALRHGLAWPFAMVASLIVRWFLIEYVGDVAAYVQPQVVDRFFELRQQIKDCVWKTAHAVFSEPDYEGVVIVGHSLGSVVVYDVLNRLILDRELAGASAPDVVSRTRLLLTFGSPLDKTAFLFAIQAPEEHAGEDGRHGRTGAARRALAASVQPLIVQQAVRPPWVNLFSRWDIISGKLDYYDIPEDADVPRNRNVVKNDIDTNATTLLAAHVEYWKNPLVFQTIVDHLF